MSHVYGRAYQLVERSPLFLNIGKIGLISLGSRPLRRAVERIDPDIIVSTHPPVTAILGHMRRRERIRVPLVATITDLEGLCFWVHRGADMHLVMHESCIPLVERLAGPGSARCARLLVAPAFREPRTRTEARQALGLPEDAAIAVVSGGGWGVGELEEAAHAALEVKDLSVICLAGRNESAKRDLELAFAGEPRISVWGFTDKMGDLLAAIDVLVHSTGGVTVLEALSRNCPVIAYGAPPGHNRLTAQALVREGLGQLANSPQELTASLRIVLERPRAESCIEPSAPSCASIAMSVTPRSPAAPELRTRVVRRVELALLALVLPLSIFSTNLPYALAAGTFHLAPLSAVATPKADTGLVIKASPALVPLLITELRRHHDHASFAFSTSVDSEVLSLLAAAQDETLPALGSGEAIHWFRTRHHLNSLFAALRVHDGDYYLAPRKLTLGEYLLARGQGALPISGSHFEAGGRVPSSALRRGNVIVLDLGTSSELEAMTTLDRLLTALNESGLRVVSVGQLRASR
jgi:UDP-N-acetylglucosamine:LPS N-acetylglucosamine transferase